METGAAGSLNQTDDRLKKPGIAADDKHRLVVKPSK
jgi:hypothetical protein